MLSYIYVKYLPLNLIFNINLPLIFCIHIFKFNSSCFIQYIYSSSVFFIAASVLSDSPLRSCAGLWRTSSPSQWSPWRLGPGRSAEGWGPYFWSWMAASAGGGRRLDLAWILCCVWVRGSAPCCQVLGVATTPPRPLQRPPQGSGPGRCWGFGWTTGGQGCRLGRIQIPRTAWRSGSPGGGLRSPRAWPTERAHYCWWRRWTDGRTLRKGEGEGGVIDRSGWQLNDVTTFFRLNQSPISSWTANHWGNQTFDRLLQSAGRGTSAGWQGLMKRITCFWEQDDYTNQLGNYFDQPKSWSWSCSWSGSRSKHLKSNIFRKIKTKFRGESSCSIIWVNCDFNLFLNGKNTKLWIKQRVWLILKVLGRYQ